jgi:large subunit ribosomal protein L3
MKGIIGKKIGMTQIFRDDGQVLPVTLIKAGPCYVVQKKTRDADGYEAIQLGFQEVRPTRANKPRAGHFQRHHTPVCRVIKEVCVEDASRFAPGQTITVEAFQVGEKVRVTGKSRGRGFTGVVKRHGFSGAPGSHGTHEYFRHGGSIGAATFPGRVLKGKRMAGQHGHKTVTVLNVRIEEIRPEEDLILVKGAVPGPNGEILLLRSEGEFPLSANQHEGEPEQPVEPSGG